MHQRLYEITLLLIEKNQINAKELAERFGVSIRTIYRDIDALSLAGMPVYTQPGRGGGIRLLPGYVLDKALFSQEERSELLSQLQGLVALGTPNTEGALHKLSALFGQADSWLEVDFAPWGDGEAHRRLFMALREAILAHTIIEFDYFGTDMQSSQRRVEPFRIIFRGQGWYLHAFCQKRQDYRFFKLTRIFGFQNTGVHFAPQPPPSGGEPVNLARPQDSGESILLRFSPHLAFRVYDEFPHSDIERNPDGSLQVSLACPVDNWLPGYLLSYGAGLQVLQPASLRQRLQEELRAMLQAYE